MLTLFGAIAGNVRMIALSTLVTILVPKERRDKANGLVRAANGAAFFFTSIFSGLVIGYLGMGWMLAIALGLTALVLAHLLTVRLAEPGAAPVEQQPQHIDLRGMIRVMALVPGLFGLVFFNTFNNFLGSVYMSLMDAYGLSLVSVQAWGLLWAFLSLGFIVGGLVVARQGLGRNPVRTLFLVNLALLALGTLDLPLPALGWPWYRPEDTVGQLRRRLLAGLAQAGIFVPEGGLGQPLPKIMPVRSSGDQAA